MKNPTKNDRPTKQVRMVLKKSTHAASAVKQFKT